MEDQYIYNLSNGKSITIKNKDERFSWTVQDQEEISHGEAKTLGDAEDAVISIALSEELKKLNSLIDKGLKGKPDKFFIDPYDSEFRHFAIVEAILDDYENDKGLEEYNINYYSINIEYGNRDDKASWNFGDRKSVV